MAGVAGAAPLWAVTFAEKETSLLQMADLTSLTTECFSLFIENPVSGCSRANNKESPQSSEVEIHL